MSSLLAVVLMSLLLGLGSFGVGMLPLAFVFSKIHLARLSTLGTGLLLGAALGVIIPEGVGTLAAAYPPSELPTSKIALSLLCGFTFILVVEQIASPHAHAHPPDLPLHSSKPISSEVEFDADLGELERDQGVGRSGSGFVRVDLPTPDVNDANKKRAYSMMLGLVTHAFADGLALGASALSTEHGASSSISLVVFLALMVHRAPTALALTTSLLTTSLTRAECKKFLLYFSASTPLAALVSYGIFLSLGWEESNDWTGIALLVSGGTFLYVATVLQPVSQHSPSSYEDMRPMTRIAFIALGMFIPFTIGAMVGHGDRHSPGIHAS
jgi:zinc transporter 9